MENNIIDILKAGTPVDVNIDAIIIEDRHIKHANNLLEDINKETCFECTKNKGNIRLALLTCKATLDSLKRHNSVHGKTDDYYKLEQVKQWLAVKEYLKSLL
jgi:hypothetical protein